MCVPRCFLTKAREPSFEVDNLKRVPAWLAVPHSCYFFVIGNSFLQIGNFCLRHKSVNLLARFPYTLIVRPSVRLDVTPYALKTDCGDPATKHRSVCNINRADLTAIEDSVYAELHTQDAANRSRPKDITCSCAKDAAEFPSAIIVPAKG